MIVLVRAVRDGRRSIFWWGVGMVALVLFTVALYPSVKGNASFDELFESLPEAVRNLVGAQEGVPLTSPAGYLHGRLFSTMVPVLFLTLSIGLGARAIGGSEADGTLELLLANPVTRVRLALARYGATLVLHAIVAAALAGSLVALAPFVGLLEGVTVGRLLAATAAALCLGLLHGTIAFAVGSATGRHGPAVAIATAVAAAGYLLEGVAAATDVLSAVQPFLPWHWYLDRNILVDGLPSVAVLAPLALSAVLVVAGTWAFDRRDLR